MKQKKLVLTVYDKDGNVQFSKDPAVPDNILAALSLFNEIGDEIYVAVREFDVDVTLNID